MKPKFLEKLFRGGSKVAATALLLALVSFYAARHITVARLAHAQVRATPFLLLMHIYNVEKSPAGELQQTRVVARRSDGTTALIGSVGRIAWDQMLKKITFMDGRSVMLSDLIASRTSLRSLNEEIAFLKKLLTAPPPDCRLSVRDVFLGNDTVLNHRVAVVQREEDPIRIVSWKAPDLGCEYLQYRGERKQPDGSFRVLRRAGP